jgi:hypothetical protein
MKRTPRAIGALAAGAFILVSIGLILVVMVPRTTTFNVTAETERVEMTLDQAPPSRWNFEAVAIKDGDLVIDPSYRGDLELAAATQVIIERIAAGPLRIFVQCLAQCTSGGRLIPLDDGVRTALPKQFDLEVNDPEERARRGQTIVLPLSGRVRVGRTIGIETGATTAMLRSGRVTMLGRSVFRHNVFEAGGLSLEAGDQFVVTGESVGVAVVDERPALTAAYRVIATSGQVVRPGGGGYRVAASTLGQLFNDELFLALSALFALSAGVVEVIGFGMKLWPQFVKDPRPVHDQPPSSESPTAAVTVPAPAPQPVVASSGAEEVSSAPPPQHPSSEPVPSVPRIEGAAP